MSARRPDLSRRLVLEGPARLPDGAGGFVESWAPLGVIWAEVGLRGGAQEAVTSNLGLKVTLRAARQGAPSRPDARQRFRDGARIYRIDAVSEADPAGRFLVCFCTEETGA